MAREESKILCILPYWPWPPRRNGASVRFLPILKHLNARSGVDLVVINDEPPATAASEIASFCRRFSIVPARRFGDVSLAMRGCYWCRGLIPHAPPYEYTDPFAMELTQRILEFIGKRHYELLYFAGINRAETFSALRKQGVAGRSVIDFVDSPYLRAVRDLATLSGFARLRHRLHCVTTRNWERHLRREADVCIYISAADAAAVGDSSANEQVAVVPNGVIEEAPASPQSLGFARAPLIGFLGNMAYPPNWQAAMRLHGIFRQLQRRIEGVGLVIVGRDPVPAVRGLAGEDVLVTGEVDAIMPYVDAIDVFVLPMYTGAGLQNKAIEIMSRARPLVVSPVCNSGIGAADGAEVLLADTDDEFVEASHRLLVDSALRRRIGDGGRNLVKRRFSWDAITADLENLIFVRDPRP